MPTKYCSRCEKAKPADKEHWYFTKGKPTSGPCKECRKAVAKANYYKDPEAANRRSRKYHTDNKEKVAEIARNWRQRNADYVREKSREKYLANREVRIEYERERRRSGVPREQARARRAANPNYYKEHRAKMKPETKAKINAWMRDYRKQNPEQFKRYETERYARDPHRKVSASLSSAVVGHLCKIGKRKSRLRREIVGWTMEELVAHLEVLFEEGMTWDNYGEWHIDHVIPKSAVKVEGDTDPLFKMIWALDNLAPLWAQDNLEKHAKLDWSLPDTYKNQRLRALYEDRNEFILILG